MTSELLEQLAQAHAALAARVAPYTVGVVRGRHAFSGIGWSADTVVTAAEPLAGAQQVRLIQGERQCSAEVLAADLGTDVAVLRTAEPLAAPATRAARDLQVAEPVLVMGREAGAPQAALTYVRHVGPAWQSRRGGHISSALQVAGTSHPSLEGGGIFSADGALAAMAVAGPRGRILGIPLATLVEVADTVASRGYLPQAYLGVALQGVWLDHAGERRPSALVTGVAADSPAAEGDVRVGDLLLAADGAAIAGPLQLLRRVRGRPIGSALALELLRGGEARAIEVRIGERPRG
ncbi:MAG: serine protease [Gammaproteobacteria bacterium]|nr:serine protease [Gammaproteobacteria bacterium]